MKNVYECIDCHRVVEIASMKVRTPMETLAISRSLCLGCLKKRVKGTTQI